MIESTIVCDRCGEEIDGLRGEFATAGFYDVTGDSWWSRYAKPGERNVCDACMWDDPEYRATYGVHPTDPGTIRVVVRAERQLHEAAGLRLEIEEVDSISRESYGETGTTI